MFHQAVRQNVTELISYLTNSTGKSKSLLQSRMKSRNGYFSVLSGKDSLSHLNSLRLWLTGHIQRYSDWPLSNFFCTNSSAELLAVHWLCLGCEWLQHASSFSFFFSSSSCLLRTRTDKCSPFYACKRSEYNHACFSHCQEFLPCPQFYRPGQFIFIFFKPSPYFLNVLS